jgi:D-3-phosphoglycerate dehydrogenase
MDLQQKTKLRILHLEYDKYSDSAFASLQNLGEVIVAEFSSQKDFNSFMQVHSFDAIFTRLGLMIDEKILATQNQLRYLVTPTTGLNHIDMEAAQGRGIHVISLKGEFEFLSGIKSTAEHTWLLLLALIRNLIPAQRNVVQAGGWERVAFLADELGGKSIGIIGFGRLGKIVAGYAKAFGMRVLAHDTDINQYKSTDGIEAVDLEYLLGNADYITLLIPYSKENIGFMDKAKFKQIKNGAYFINTARGELVVEDALLGALESGKLKGAALDVLHGDSAWEKSIPQGNVVLEYAQTHPNLIITPHMGGYGKESIIRTRDFVVNKFLEKLEKT